MVALRLIVRLSALACVLGCSDASSIVEARISRAEKTTLDEIAEMKSEIASLKAQAAKRDEEVSGKLSLLMTGSAMSRAETGTKLLIADEVQTKKLIVLASDEPDCARIVLGRIKDVMSFTIYRDTSTPMLSLSVATSDSNGELVMYDKTLVPRLKVRVLGNGDAALVIADDKQKPRLGMMSTHDGEAEFLRFDKFGNLKSLK